MAQNVPLFVYRDQVEALADKHNGEPVYNSSLEHTAIVLQSMLSRARRSVKLLTGELNRNAYGRRTVVEQIRRFVEDKSHSVKILCEDKTLADGEARETHPFLQAVKSKSHVELRHVPRGLQSRYSFHFMLVDGDSYRFEPDRDKFGAVAAFGDKDGGKNLDHIFSTLWAAAGVASAEVGVPDRVTAPDKGRAG